MFFSKQVISLPSQTCTYRVKVAEASYVVRADIIEIQSKCQELHKSYILFIFSPSETLLQKNRRETPDLNTIVLTGFKIYFRFDSNHHDSLSAGLIQYFPICNIQGGSALSGLQNKSYFTMQGRLIEGFFSLLFHPKRLGWNPCKALLLLCYHVLQCINQTLYLYMGLY